MALGPKGARAHQGLSTARARRSLQTVADPTPSTVRVLMTFGGEQNKLKMYGTVPSLDG